MGSVTMVFVFIIQYVFNIDSKTGGKLYYKKDDLVYCVFCKQDVLFSDLEKDYMICKSCKKKQEEYKQQNKQIDKDKLMTHCFGCKESVKIIEFDKAQGKCYQCLEKIKNQAETP